jgi:hypothetical protein
MKYGRVEPTSNFVAIGCGNGFENCVHAKNKQKSSGKSSAHIKQIMIHTISLFHIFQSAQFMKVYK